ncbi:MAG: addiction module protein [Gammaproteobacteria bacterium]|nr:addiction module protein [Gammaproteobacteria bacterium]MDH4316045.1 addiction module protein [Gammaproteobacteria bacterium]MDH5213929.1 addiction module protein [Gammaproteobacteria bacterium]
MAATTQELYERAMSLNDEDRAELVGLLLESLEIVADDDVEAAWLKEIERRVSELDSGAVKSVPWTEVRSRVFEPRAR